MNVVVDDRALEAEKMGLKTVGQVLAHLQRENRLVVHVLIDGKEPDLAGLPAIRASALKDHTVYIETAEPRKMALEVLAEVNHQLDEADRLRADAVDLLQSNSQTKAMEKLAGCFTTWAHAEESIRKVAQLLRVDLSRIVVDDQPFTNVLTNFADQFRSIRNALEDRDFVALSDTLAYEATQTTRQWKDAVAAMRGMVE
jgi:hypothetical protein